MVVQCRWNLIFSCLFVEESRDSKIFVTIPRFQPGSPIALGTVSDKVRDNNPILVPYPSWDWFRNPEACKPDRIVSVYRVQVSFTFTVRYVINYKRVAPKNLFPYISDWSMWKIMGSRYRETQRQNTVRSTSFGIRFKNGKLF